MKHQEVMAVLEAQDTKMQVYVNLEYPSYFLADELPIHFMGCDFKCPYCYTPEILSFKPDFLVDIKEIKRYIEQSPIEKIVFTGGEPCLQRQGLLSLARFTKKIGKRVILDTNGSKPDTLKSLLIAGVVDEVRMDLKSRFNSDKFEKTTRSKTFFISSDDIISDIRRSINMLKEYKKIDVFFITIIVPSVTFKKEEISEIINEIKDIRGTYIIQGFVSKNEHVDNKFRDISSPTEKFLNSLKDYVEKNTSIPIEIRSNQY